MSFNFRLGLNAKAYRAAALFTGNDSSDVTGATLTEIGNIRDVTINGQTGEADIATRETEGWEATAATLRSMEVSFQMLAKAPDANLSAIRTAWITNAEIALVFLTGAEDESYNDGPAANFTVTNFSRGEQLREGVLYDVTVKAANQQQWYTVA